MNVRIKSNKPNSEQRKALKQQVAIEFNKLLDRYNRDTAIQILYVLHFDYGFGEKRLKDFADKLLQMHKDMDYRYELSPGDTPWLCETKLKESGIDVEKLLRCDNE